MSIFCYKKIKPGVRLGEKLNEARLAARLEFKELSNTTHIAVNYLEAIETCNYKKLPKAAAFRRAYIKEFANALNLNAEDCVKQFVAEGGLSDAKQVHPHQQISFSHFTSISMAIRNGLLIGVVVLFAGYLTWQIRGILQPPRLTLISPQEGEIVTGLSVAIAGQTEPEVTLKINGQDIMVNEAGAFDTKIDVASGLNTLTFQAIKKHGKISTITRHVVVKERKLGINY